MRVRSLLFIALLVCAPGAASAQWRTPSSPPERAPLAPLAAPAREPREVALPVPRDPRGSAAEHAMIGALTGAAVGLAASVVHDATSKHTDHSYDSLVRFSMVSAGALLGAVGGMVVYVLRAR